MKQFQVRIDVENVKPGTNRITCRVVSSNSPSMRLSRLRKGKVAIHRVTFWCDSSRAIFNIVESINTAVKNGTVVLPFTQHKRLITGLWGLGIQDSESTFCHPDELGAVEFSFTSVVEEFNAD